MPRLSLSLGRTSSLRVPHSVVDDLIEQVFPEMIGYNVDLLEVLLSEECRMRR